MGILDDAIKEHLDLKRLHGADDSEVKRLEDEAFGPPTRPGEPDFPESQEQPALGEQPTGADVASSEAPTGAEATGADTGAEDATALLEPEKAPAPEPPAPPPSEEASIEPEPPSEEQPTEQAAPAEQAPPAEPAAAAPAPEAPAEPPTDTGAFYDQADQAGAVDVDDLDLDLADEDVEELRDAPETGEHAEDEGPPSEELPAEDHPIAGQETEEHPMEELLADEAGVEVPPGTGAPATDEEALPEGEPQAPATGEEPAEGAAPTTDPEGEDVLEETPEFLRDRPEDDELWFEQREPKDFDF